MIALPRILAIASAPALALTVTVAAQNPAVRATAAGVTGVALLAGLSLAGALRERDQLPKAAQSFLQATIQASSVTSCLQGARDELFVPGRGELHTSEAAQSALARLRSCDVAGLESALNAVHLPPAAPVTDKPRREARADLVQGLATLRRMVLDARGADIAMTRNVKDAADGTAVILAYRSASAGSDRAYTLAEEALALLGRPQSTVAS